MNKPKKQLFVGLSLLGTSIGLALGCSAGTVDDATEDGTSPVGEIAEALGSGDQCPTTTADFTINGSGSVTSSRTYDHSGCFQGYLVDINKYDPQNAGSFAYYAETEPTNQNACINTQMRVYAWKRNTDGTTTFLGGTFPKGQWVTNRAGQSGCIVPRVNIEDIPGFVADGSNYRLGMRAQDLLATTDGRKSIYFETVVREDPAARRASLRQEIASAPAGTIVPRIHNAFQLRTNGAQEVECRLITLTRSLYDFSKPSFQKAGASDAAIFAARNALSSIESAFCLNQPGTEAQFQSAVKAYLDGSDQMQREIAAAIGTTLSGKTPPMTQALNVMAQILQVDVGRLTANCGLDRNKVVNFLLNGTLPQGVVANTLMMGNCSGQPVTVATQLGVGGSLTASTLKTRLKECLTPKDVVGTTRDICNNPRAAGAEDETQDGADFGACKHHDGTPCTQEEIDEDKAVLKEQADLEAAVKEYEKTVQTFNEGLEAGKKKAAQEIKDKQESDLHHSLETVIDYAASFVTRAGLGRVLGMLKVISAVTHENPLDPCPNGPGKCQAYCAADYAPGGYYGSQLDLNFGSSRQLSQDDLTAHCLCKVMEEEYEARTGNVIGLSSACPSPTDQKQLDCLANPYGPDDKPRKECVENLLPGNISDEAWRGKICAAVRCADPINQLPALDTNDACSCIPKPRPIGSGTPGCKTDQLVFCSSDGFGNCDQCLDTKNGALPHGNDPRCRLDTTAWPGSLDGLLRSNPDAVTLHTLGTETFVMMDSRVSTAPSFVTPTYAREAFANLGTVVRQRTLVSAAPRTGQNLDLQLYCTNYGNNLIHNFMGQCRLNTQTPGTVGSCDITLNASTRSACLGGNFEFEYVSQAPSAYQGKIGAGPWTFAGTLTPPSIVNPVCPAPNPLDVFPQTNPVWTLAGGTPIQPNPTFELASGTDLRIPAAIYTPDRTVIR